MPFTIPNAADASHVSQSQPDKVDMDILVAGYSESGVVSGCAVTAQGSPDMTVAVAAGTITFEGVAAAVSSGNVTITTADGTNPRFDLIVASSTGTKSAQAGTPAASPVFPAIPASSVVLAAVHVPASDTTISSGQIVDKRVILGSTPAVATDTIWDAAGDLVQGTGANTAARLALGTAGKVLAVNAGATAVEWATPTGTGVDAGGRVDTTETTASTTYVDLTTSGPAATVVVPPTGEVLVTLTATMDQSSATGYALMSVALSGANTVAASDTVSLVKLNTNFETKSGTYLFTGLTPGSTTFTAKYRADTAGTAEFSRRNIVVSVSGAAAGVVATDTVWDTAGDIVQGTGANTAAKLAIGTAGQVLTVNSGATAAAWASVGADGADNISHYNAAFGASIGYDQEFAAVGTSLPSGWSWLNQGTATYREELGAGIITMPAGTTVAWRGLVRALPTEATWTAIAKVTHTMKAATGNYSGLVLRQSSDGKMINFARYTLANTGASGDQQAYLDRWTNATTYSAAIANTAVADRTTYYRIRRASATSYYFAVSSDGVSWIPIQDNYDVSAYITPNEIGFGLSFQGNVIADGACHWFRVR